MASKKLLLATNYVELKKEFDGDSFKAGLRDHNPEWLASHFTVASLEEKIEAVTNALESKKKRLALEAYYETEEGKEFLADIDNKLTWYANDRRFLKNQFEHDVELLLNKLLGNGWGVNYSNSLGGGNVEIGLLNTDSGRNFKFEFGHSFTIYWELKDWKTNKERLEMNYGTMVAFDLNDPNGLRKKYLLGMATIANHTEFLRTLSNMFKELDKKMSEIYFKMDKLNVLRNEGPEKF